MQSKWSAPGTGGSTRLLGWRCKLMWSSAIRALAALVALISPCIGDPPPLNGYTSTCVQTDGCNLCLKILGYLWRPRHHCRNHWRPASQGGTRPQPGGHGLLAASTEPRANHLIHIQNTRPIKPYLSLRHDCKAKTMCSQLLPNIYGSGANWCETATLFQQFCSKF